MAGGLAHVEGDDELRALTKQLAHVRDGGVGDAHVGVDVQARLAAKQRESANADALLASLKPLAGLSNAKSTRTALALLVPEAQRAKIDAVRATHDPAFSRWPAHANLLFPFVADDEAVDVRVLQCLDDAMRQLPPFHVKLASLRVFAKSRTLYLAVETTPKHALEPAYKAVAALFPQCVKRHTFEPHVTVARGDVATLEQLAVELRAKWGDAPAASFTCSGLSVLTRGAATPFVERHVATFEAPAVGALAQQAADGDGGSAWRFDAQRYRAVVREELWRRALRSHYRSQPPPVRDAILERLLYGDSAVDDGGDGATESNATADGAADEESWKTGPGTDRKLNERFALFARATWGELAKKKNEAALRRGAPEFENLLRDGEAFAERRLVPHGVDAALDAQRAAVVREQLALIDGARLAFRYTLGDDSALPERERFVMLVQALRFAGPHALQAVENGTWRNTCDVAVGEQVQLLESLHARFEASRRERAESLRASINAQRVALSIARCPHREAFAGRCLAACATRGGKVFDALVPLLSCDEREYPLLADKLRAILLGGIGDERPLFGGLPWVQCPLSTALNVRTRLGEAEFARVELAMHSSEVGWVYRVSDIPNRHGHCNSHPNPALVMSFAGFELDRFMRENNETL